jgi:hypothetical protein
MLKEISRITHSLHATPAQCERRRRIGSHEDGATAAEASPKLLPIAQAPALVMVQMYY